MQTKSFCKTCGSPIMSKNSLSPNVTRIRPGTIESDIKERPEAHVFVASKVNWEDLEHQSPKFVAYK